MIRSLLKRLFDYRNERPVSQPRTFQVVTFEMLDGQHTTNKAIMVDTMPDGTIIETEVIFFPFGCSLLLDGTRIFLDKQGKTYIP